MTEYVVRLQFTADGPLVSGTWQVLPSADRTYRNWVALYGNHLTAVITLLEDQHGEERVMKRWSLAEGEQYE
ncbi:hypothetical protein ACFYYM_39945 [Streptomyces erythrochromogenes]|uniref:hypothetical protein n=1 Tax=Streptomyces erythrochromogenes TaxID=285574 RepID=UPI0036960F5E